jgi:hypothetical protein
MTPMLACSLHPEFLTRKTRDVACHTVLPTAMVPALASHHQTPLVTSCQSPVLYCATFHVIDILSSRMNIKGIMSFAGHFPPHPRFQLSTWLDRDLPFVLTAPSSRKVIIVNHNHLELWQQLRPWNTI